MINKVKALGVALVGLGNYSTRNLAPAFEHSQLCALAGIVTGTPVKASMWSRKYDISKKNTYNYGNFERIIENEDIDIVYVVLPNALHAEYVIRAAQAKKHVICQKPMAVSSNECSEMIAACKENGVKLSIDYRLHFDPFHQYLMSVDEPIMEINGAFAFELKNHSQWRQDKRLSGGGALMDLGIYGVQAGCYLSDTQPEFVTAQSTAGRSLARQSIEESIQFQMHFNNNVTTSFSSSYNTTANELHVQTSTDKYELRKSRKRICEY
jgi:predicted dehydrogenase